MLTDRRVAPPDPRTCTQRPFNFIPNIPTACFRNIRNVDFFSKHGAQRYHYTITMLVHNYKR
eukprot:746402-Prorocentrum_minimum.AAC.1